MGRPFKILSIDGGGFRGAYAAHLLKRIEDEFHVNWGEDFDLLAGTSTGSIIAAALAVGASAARVLNMYKEKGRSIFPTHVPPRRGLLHSKYSSAPLRAALSEFFGTMKLGDIETPLIIPATDIGSGRVHVLKSGYDKGFVRDKDVPVVEAVLASCSAPTFFPPVLLSGDKPYLLADGGLWANSPSLVAAIDAKRRLGANLEDLQILSIGTGSANTFYPIREAKTRGLFGWGILARWKRQKFVEMLLNLQSQNANNMLGLLLESKQVLRLNFESDKDLPLDAPDEFEDLVSRADREFTHESASLQKFIQEKNEHE